MWESKMVEHIPLIAVDDGEPDDGLRQELTQECHRDITIRPFYPVLRRDELQWDGRYFRTSGYYSLYCRFERRPYPLRERIGVDDYSFQESVDFSRETRRVRRCLGRDLYCRIILDAFLDVFKKVFQVCHRAVDVAGQGRDERQLNHSARGDARADFVQLFRQSGDGSCNVVCGRRQVFDFDALRLRFGLLPVCAEQGLDAYLHRANGVLDFLPYVLDLLVCRDVLGEVQLADVDTDFDMLVIALNDRLYRFLERKSRITALGRTAF